MRPQYFVAGRMDEAMALLQQLRREKPDDIALLNHLGEVYVAAGKLDEGMAMLEQVVAKEPERFEAHVNLASGIPETERARQGARRGRSRARAEPDARARARDEGTRALARRRRSRRGAGVQDRASLGPAQRPRHRLGGDGRDEPARARRDALESFGRATRLDPTRVDAWVGVANATMALGEWDRAAAALQHAAQLSPDSPDVKQAANQLRSLRR